MTHDYEHIVTQLRGTWIIKVQTIQTLHILVTYYLVPKLKLLFMLSNNISALQMYIDNKNLKGKETGKRL